MQLEKRFRKHTIILQIEANGKKKVVVDGIPVKRAAELIGVLGVVYFHLTKCALSKKLLRSAGVFWTSDFLNNNGRILPRCRDTTK